MAFNTKYNQKMLNLTIKQNHRWTMGGVEGGHPPLLAKISTSPLELNYTPLSEKDLTPLDFFVTGKIFHTVKSP